MSIKYGPSLSEKVLIKELIRIGLNPNAQYEIGRTHVDIAFPEEKLLIEVNGPHHDVNEQAMRDRRRSRFQEKKGWKIKSYSSYRAFNETKLVAEEIKKDIFKLRNGETINWNPETLSNIEKYMDDNFKHLLKLVESSSNSLFITGKAGTGKSTFLRIFMNKTQKNVVVLAPTGLAAMNIKGQTIHSFFKLKPGIISEDDIEESVLNEKVKLLCSVLDYLIIDEISMVRADMFDAIDRILRSIKDNNKPFGGVKLILFGDLYQLPPIINNKEKYILTNNYDYKIFYFFGSKVFKKMNIEIENLTKVYRQSDIEFINLLDRVRNGELTPEDIELFKTRLIKYPDELKYTPVILTSTNKNVKKYNENKLNEIKEQSHFYEGEINGKFSNDSFPVELQLELKKGARVMTLRNINGKFVNGDLGTVMACDKKCVIVKLDRTGKNEIVFREMWNKYEFYFDKDIGKIRKWTSGNMIQIPLKLAWAMTIHKSQGLTLNNIYVDSTPGIWSEGQLYVALSRCKSFKGLYLKEVPKSDYFHSNYAVDEFFNTAEA